MDQPADLQGGNVALGPYRATQLWNDVIQTFRNGIATGRHRRQLKSYDACFVGSDAVTWLHEHLQNNPNFGETVTRNQTVQLLEKFHKAHLFEDVRVYKSVKEEFTDSGRLFRFRTSSDSSNGSKGLSRTPLATRTSLMNADDNPDMPQPMKGETPKPPSRGTPSTNGVEAECHLVARPGVLTRQEVEDIWKDITLTSLQRILQLKMIDEVLDSASVDVGNIIHNMTQVNRNGIVSNIDKKDQLPHWVISAMRCLAYWPAEVDQDLPSFKGFEKDVFKVVKDYFDLLPEPLVTFPLYEVFINCMAYVDSMGKPFRASQRAPVKTPPQGLKSFASAENLILNMTQNTRESADDVMIVHDPEVADPGRGQGPLYSTQSLPRQASQASMQGARIETSFGVVAGREPKSHVYHHPPEPRRGGPQTAQRTDSFMMSLDNVYDRTSSVEPSVPARSRYYSMSNVNDVAPFPENNIKGYRPRSGTPDSWSSSVHSVKPVRAPSHTDFGYTVVLSTAPKIAVEPSSQYPYSGAPSSQYPHSGAPSSQYPHSGAPSSQYPHGGAQWGNQRNGLSGHGYCGYAESCDSGLNSKRASYTSDFSDAPSVRPSDPPPYVPPPSYNTLFIGRTRSDTWSASSFETAKSHNSSVSSSNQNSPASLYQSAQNSPADQVVPPGVTRGTTPQLPGQRTNLAESYRAAIDNSVCGGSTPVGRSLFAPMKRSNSSPSILSPISKNRIQEVLQICCLVLPPANRRKLHLLLRFMNKVINNSQLSLEKGASNRRVLLRTFTRAVMRPEDEADYDEIFTLHIVSFLIDNYQDIMKVPVNLKLKIDDRIAYEKRKKIRFVWDETPTLAFCEQVTVAEFERQRMSSSQRALNDLLESIIKDRAMTTKDKKRRLKQFQKSYPDIYSRRLPTSESEAGLFPGKPKIKQALLRRPLQKLKSLRL